MPVCSEMHEAEEERGEEERRHRRYACEVVLCSIEKRIVVNKRSVVVAPSELIRCYTASTVVGRMR